MTRKMPSRSYVISLLLAASFVVLAQEDKGTLLRGAEVTEERIVDVLTPAAEAPLSRGLRPAVTKPIAPVTKKPSAMLLITFDTNSTELTKASKEQLDVVAAALKNEKLRSFSFEVEGHADSRGSVEGNQLLSQQRAEVARRYLIEAHGIAESRLRAVGKGDSMPLNTRDIAAPENRRVAVTTVVH